MKALARQSILTLLLFPLSQIALGAPPPIEVVVTVFGNGVVTSQPLGIACPPDCTENYRTNTTLQLTAAAPENYAFVRWTGACQGTDPICAFKVSADRNTVTATFEIAVCTNVFPATGQTICYDPSTNFPTECAGTGQDGDIQAGATLSYFDNGNGTITDLNTRLTWEKKDFAAGSIHNKTTTRTWPVAFDFIYALNNTCDGNGAVACADDAQCGAGGVCGFAGHRDWRLPNVKELESIVDYGANGGDPPTVAPAFNNACVPGCSINNCSCTANFDDGSTYWYWTSTSRPYSPVCPDCANNSAMFVGFDGGWIFHADREAALGVRAVRGGL